MFDSRINTFFVVVSSVYICKWRFELPVLYLVKNLPPQNTRPLYFQEHLILYTKSICSIPKYDKLLLDHWKVLWEFFKKQTTRRELQSAVVGFPRRASSVNSKMNRGRGHGLRRNGWWKQFGEDLLQQFSWELICKNWVHVFFQYIVWSCEILKFWVTSSQFCQNWCCNMIKQLYCGILSTNVWCCFALYFDHRFSCQSFGWLQNLRQIAIRGENLMDSRCLVFRGNNIQPQNGVQELGQQFFDHQPWSYRLHWQNFGGAKECQTIVKWHIFKN